jgi:hypothetical protein
MTSITSTGAPVHNKKPSRSKKYSDPVSLAAAARAIYSGEDRLGHVVPNGARVDSYDRMGRLVGTFPNILDAVASLGGVARVRR